MRNDDRFASEVQSRVVLRMGCDTSDRREQYCRKSGSNQAQSDANEYMIGTTSSVNPDWLKCVEVSPLFPRLCIGARPGSDIELKGGVQGRRAAYELAPFQEEAQRPHRILGYSDSHADADVSRRFPVRGKPKRARGAQVDSVKAAVDIEGFGQAARSRKRSRVGTSPRRRLMASSPATGSAARISTASPMPASALVTFSIKDTP